MIYKTLFVLSVVAFAAILIFESSGPPEIGAENPPSFVNPFETQVFRYTAFPDSPVIPGVGSTAAITWVGCENTTTQRGRCIDKRDDERSYVQMNLTDDDLAGHSFNFDYSSRDLPDLNESEVRRYIWTVDCRTVIGGEVAARLSMGGAPFPAVLTCPFDEAFRVAVFDRSTPNGVSTIISDATTVNARSCDTLEFGPCFNTTVQITTIKLEVTVGEEDAAGTGCQAPEGAWFPWADEVACAIGQFGQLVWKSFIFVFNGLIYIGGWFVFAGQYVASAVAVIAWLFAIPGVPTQIQAFIDAVIVLWLVVIGVEAYRKINPFA